MKRHLTIIMCAAVTLICSVMTYAAGPSASWEFAGWHGGGCFPSIVFDPSVQNRVYAASDVAGIFRSDDLGEHWYFVTKGLGNLTVSQVAVAPSDPDILYAAAGNGVYVSRNAGGLWSKADTMRNTIRFIRPENYRSIVVDPVEPGRVCAGTASGRLYCSKNFGSSWRDLDQAKVLAGAKPITALAMDSQRKFIYAATNKCLNRCALDGSGCSQLANGPQKVTDLVISKTSPQTIYAAGEKVLWISRDEGGTWVRSSPVPQGETFRVDVVGAGPQAVIRVIWNKDWNGGVLLTRDQGATWESQDKQLNSDLVNAPAHLWVQKGGRSTALASDPFNDQVIFRADFFGIWRSDDGGISWYEKVIGAPNTVATDIVVSPSGDIIVATMDNGLLRSSDSGKQYHMLFPLKYDDLQAGHIWRVVMAGDTIIATSSPWNKIINQVIISNDGAKTFEMVRNGLPEKRPRVNTLWGEGYPRGLAVDPKDPDLIYLGIDGDDGGGLYISRDRGQTWQRSAGQPGSLKIYKALSVDPTNTKRIIWGANGQGGGVYISNDGGASFVHSLKEMSWVFDVKVASDGTIFAAGDSGGPQLYISTDHGQSWSASFNDFGKDRAMATIAVDPSDPKKVAVATASWSSDAPCKIFYSEDGGKRFRDITGNLPDGAGASFMMIDPKSNSLYITRYAGSVYRLKL